MSDNINFGHSLGLGRCWNMSLEMLIAVIDGLDPGPLSRVPPGHGHGNRRGYRVSMDRVVDHSTAKFTW